MIFNDSGVCIKNAQVQKSTRCAPPCPHPNVGRCGCATRPPYPHINVGIFGDGRLFCSHLHSREKVTLAFTMQAFPFE